MRFLMGMYTSILTIDIFLYTTFFTNKPKVHLDRSEVFELPMDVDSLKTNEFIPESETMRLSFGWI